jgi:hypothetical protein
MTVQERVNGFAQLGECFKLISTNQEVDGKSVLLSDLLESYYLANSWYTPASIRYRLTQLANNLQEQALNNWLSRYCLSDGFKEVTVGVIMAGNLPLVGFDDFCAVLLSGARLSVKLPSDDLRLMPAVAQILTEIEPRFEQQIKFTDGKFSQIDMVIATGSNNSSRYFDYYFGKYPHIIRRNRHGVAVLDGSETDEELKALGNDIFQYFGLGCRSVSKLYVPENYSFDKFFHAIVDFGSSLMNHKKYMNNYEYHKTLFLLGKQKLLDNHFVLLKEDPTLASPPGVIHWESYTDNVDLAQKLQLENESVQCIIGHSDVHPKALKFGTAQEPELIDYADGVDTMKFILTSLESIGLH